MSCKVAKIENLSDKQPIFKEFCKRNNLGNGDFYKPKDYILFADSLTYSEIVRILKRSNSNERNSNER